MYITFTRDPIHMYAYCTRNVYVNNAYYVNLCADLYCTIDYLSPCAKAIALASGHVFISTSACNSTHPTYTYTNKGTYSTDQRKGYS